MSGTWKSNLGPKFYKGHKLETPWNNDLHHMRMIENESHYYKMIDEKTFNPPRNRNPLCLTLKEMCDDETHGAKFALRQTNGIRPTLSARSELVTGRKCEKTAELLAETSGMFELEIPLLREQVSQTEQRIAALEKRHRSKTGAITPITRGSESRRGSESGTRRKMYSPKRTAMSKSRAKSACSVRSTSSALLGAHSALDKLSKLGRPQTAKTTKTVLSHRLREGWASSLRGGEIVSFAGSNMPQRALPARNVDHSSGQVRVRPGRPRTASVLRDSKGGGALVPGYRPPEHDVIEPGRDPYTGAEG